MASIKKQIRTNQALEVIMHSKNGMSITQACREVRIARSTFYLFLDRNPDLMADFRELELANARKQYIVILGSRLKMVLMLCEDAVAEKTKPLKRLKIIQYMDKRIEELDQHLRTYSSTASREEVAELLTGPKLIPGKSRLHNSETPAGTIDNLITSGSAPG